MPAEAVQSARPTEMLRVGAYGTLKVASQASKKTNFLRDVNQGVPQIAPSSGMANNSLLRRYVYGAHRISRTSGNNTSYYIHDGLGSVANLTSSSGATQWTRSYEPFGTIRTETKASGNQPDNFMTFTGEYLDPDRALPAAGAAVCRSPCVAFRLSAGGTARASFPRSALGRRLSAVEHVVVVESESGSWLSLRAS